VVGIVAVDGAVVPVELGIVRVGGSGREVSGMVLDELDGHFAVALRGLGIVEDLHDVRLIERDVGFL